MRLTKLVLEDFKQVKKVELTLAGLNVLVGGNNAGKSSVLQGIHFSVAAAVASRIAGKDTYPQDSLMYCPARNFEDLRHGAGYTNQTNFSFLRVTAPAPDGSGNVTHTVRVYRGRNEGNVGCIRHSLPAGQPALAAAISSSTDLFSIYVPGLAGIPQAEQYRTESVIRRGVASGDANMYLRNVVLQIQRKNLLPALNQRMRKLFPKFHIEITFDPKRDIYINVDVSINGSSGRRCPLELVGTGILQSLQIFSYVTLFEPKLLLLDEPDSHLHPDNQILLASALQFIASETSTQVIVSTHSRHLVDALYEDSNFVWLKNGKVSQQGMSLDLLPMLLEIGALDSYDKLKAGSVETVILTEDRKMEFLKALTIASGIEIKSVMFFSYKTSTNLEAAIMLAEFLGQIAPNTKVIVHRDRDFMTDEEVELVKSRIATTGARCYITAGSDVESYFVAPAHIAKLLGVETDEVRDWIDSLAQGIHNELSLTFGRKRAEVKNLLYRKNPNDFPDTATLLGKKIPLPEINRKGKDMLKIVRANIHERFGKTISIETPTVYLKSAELKDLADKNLPD